MNTSIFKRIGGLVFLTLATLPSGCAWVPTIMSHSIDAATTLAEQRSLYNVAQDYSIKQEITGRFLDENLLLEVNTDVYKGRVMLTGAVKTPTARKRAAELARQTADVRDVFNEIQINEDGRALSIAHGFIVEAKLKAKLVTADGIRSINYRWRATNGVVYLLGTAGSSEEFARVMSIVQGTHGVRTVVSHVIPVGLNERFVMPAARTNGLYNGLVVDGQTDTVLEGRVLSVQQGDTMTVLLAGKRENVRLIGTDMPEHSPYRKQARELLRRLVTGKVVRVETDTVTRDASKRLLAYVYADDVFVNLELIRQGQAAAYNTPPNVKHAAKYLSAAQEALDSGRGMWARDTSSIALIRCVRTTTKPGICS